MPSMQNVISAHNKVILAKQPQTNITDANKECNCSQNASCPIFGKCLKESVVYQATVTRKDAKEEKTYVGHTRGQFKTRYNNHTNYFRNAKHKHATGSATALSKYVWFLKESNVQYSMNWNIIKNARVIQTKPNDATYAYMKNL